MSMDAMLASAGIYVLVISALALGVERIMDLVKTMFDKQLVRQANFAETDTTTKKEQFKIEEIRKRYIRIWAIPIGILLAVLTQVDTFDLLGFPSPMWFGFPIIGWTISGLAASRGSAFWHDIIDLIGTVKEAKRQVAETGKD